jgi:hypothetical protein
MRNTSNTAWVYLGNVDEEYGGAAALAGATFTGPVTAPDVPPETDPDFLGTARQNGIPLALQTALSAQERRLYDRLDFLVEQQFLSKSRRSGSSADIAFDKTVVTLSQTDLVDNGVTVALPVFDSDGITATWDQVLMYCAIPVGRAWHDNSISGVNDAFRLLETSEGSHVFKPVFDGTTAWSYNWSLEWSILTLAFAVR